MNLINLRIRTSRGPADYWAIAVRRRWVILLPAVSLLGCGLERELVFAGHVQIRGPHPRRAAEGSRTVCCSQRHRQSSGSLAKHDAADPQSNAPPGNHRSLPSLPKSAGLGRLDASRRCRRTNAQRYKDRLSRFCVPSRAAHCVQDSLFDRLARASTTGKHGTYLSLH